MIPHLKTCQELPIFFLLGYKITNKVFGPPEKSETKWKNAAGNRTEPRQTQRDRCGCWARENIFYQSFFFFYRRSLLQALLTYFPRFMNGRTNCDKIPVSISPSIGAFICLKTTPWLVRAKEWHLKRKKKKNRRIVKMYLWWKTCFQHKGTASNMHVWRVVLSRMWLVSVSCAATWNWFEGPRWKILKNPHVIRGITI